MALRSLQSLLVVAAALLACPVSGVRIVKRKVRQVPAAPAAPAAAAAEAAPVASPDADAARRPPLAETIGGEEKGEEVPTSAVLGELVTAATTRGMDQADLRDQLRDLYPEYEWVVLKLESNLVSTWGWSYTGYLIGGDDNMLVLGAECSRPPACGACEKEVQAGIDSAIGSNDPGSMRTDLWNALESSGRWNVGAAKAGKWNLAWYAKPEGQRCMFYGSEATWFGEHRVFVLQLESPGTLQALNASATDSEGDLTAVTDSEALNASATDSEGDLTAVTDSEALNASATDSEGDLTAVTKASPKASAALVDLDDAPSAGEMEVGEASSSYW